MSTYLMVQGTDPIELHESESFNKVRGRVNRALTGTNHLKEKADDKERATPLNVLSFHTAEDGRVAVNPEKVIGVGSDEWSDKREGSEDDDEDDE